MDLQYVLQHGELSQDDMVFLFMITVVVVLITYFSGALSQPKNNDVLKKKN
jgi:hypothetical protein